MSEQWQSPPPPPGSGGDPTWGQPSPWDAPGAPPQAPPVAPPAGPQYAPPSDPSQPPPYVPAQAPPAGPPHAPPIAPPVQPGGWGSPSPGTATPDDPLRTRQLTPQEIWEQPQSWDPQPRVSYPPPGAHPGGPYAAGPAHGYAQPYGYAQAYPLMKPARGSVRQPQSLKTAVGIMWIGAAVQALGALSTVLFVSQIREEAEEQLLADGQVASESTLDAAVTVGVVFAIVFGLLYAGLWAWMAVKNGAGRSWARIVASVFAGLGILFNLLGLVGAGFNGASGTTTPGLVQNVITLGLAIGATVMMWRSENALYYQANS